MATAVRPGPTGRPGTGRRSRPSTSRTARSGWCPARAGQQRQELVDHHARRVGVAARVPVLVGAAVDRGDGERRAAGATASARNRCRCRLPRERVPVAAAAPVQRDQHRQVVADRAGWVGHAPGRPGAVPGGRGEAAADQPARRRSSELRPAQWPGRGRAGLRYRAPRPPRRRARRGRRAAPPGGAGSVNAARGSARA